MSKPLKILLVEDDPLCQNMTALILKRCHCEVVSAQTGQEALWQLSQQTFHGVLCDFMLPDMVATDVMMQINHHPQWRLLIRVVLTAMIDHDMAITLKKLDLNEIILKPLSLANAEAILSHHWDSQCGISPTDHNIHGIHRLYSSMDALAIVGKGNVIVLIHWRLGCIKYI